MMETLNITLKTVQPVDIHGSRYYDISFDYNGRNQLLRINPEAFYANPQPGDRVRANLVMGNILSAERVDG
jgi:hypothetical protein